MRRKPFVMIIDEDLYLAGVYARRLEMEKCQARVCRTIEEAKKRLKRTVPDAIMLDMAVDEEPGLTFVRDLRQQESTKHVHILIVTRLGSRQSIARAKEAGADAYLIKGHFLPIDAAKTVVRLMTAAHA
jgi:DNA-binding response OmpR family regulator